MNTQPVFTIGHSSRPLGVFLALLAAARVGCVVDVRRLPGSRTFPQYDADALAQSLAQKNMDYWHLGALCGRRTAGEVQGLPQGDFWRNASFARYAAWARGETFAEGLQLLIERAQATRCAVMCSEAVWWRCHRRIIADHLLARGVDVRHILGPDRTEAAELTRGACIRHRTVVYPPAQPQAGQRVVSPAPPAER